jgi:hypothetical protein
MKLINEISYNNGISVKIFIPETTKLSVILEELQKETDVILKMGYGIVDISIMQDYITIKYMQNE